MGQSSDVALAFQPGHDYLTFIDEGTLTQPQALNIWDVVSGKLIKSYPFTIPGPFAWSPDGHYLAYSGPPNIGIKIADMSSGKIVYIYTAYQTALNPLTWSPNGKYIASIDETLPQPQQSLSSAVIKVWLVA